MVDVIITSSEEFRVGECRILSSPKECEGCTVLVPEVVLWHRRYFIPVGILTPLLGAYLALPPVVATKRGHHFKALMYHESLVSLEGPGILKLVNMMGEHKNCKIP